MTVTIELTPVEESRLAAAARQTGLAPAEAARKVLTEHLPPVTFAENGGIAPKNAAAIALLRGWRSEEATTDPETIRQAEAELEELKRGLNANRAATGERPVFPE